jgi:LPXTG-motif cell wall-anchored protein
MEMKKLAFGGLAVAAGLTLTLSATPAMAVTSTTSFKVTSMTTDNSVTVDANATSGDDGGFLAITTDVLLRDGDTEVYSYNKSTLVAVGGSLTALKANDLFSDLATATAYEFITSDDGYTGAFVLDAAGNRTATELTFSEVIPVGNDRDWVGASGAGQVAFWNGITGDIWVVSLPAGTITKVTGQSLFSAFAVEPAKFNGEGTDLMQAGILEYNCTAYSFLLMDGSVDANLVRYNVADATDELILEGDDNSDIDTIMVSPTDSRWYVHTEDAGSSVFGIDVSGLSEPIVAGDAVTTSGACADTPTLPDTGMSENAGIWAASAALIAGLGVAGVFMARRRQA